MAHTQKKVPRPRAAIPRPLVAVDIFCGAGGLTYGLQKAGIRVVAGIDLDPACKYPFEHNNNSQFIEADIGNISAHRLRRLYPRGCLRVLAGCAPCQPFSAHRRGEDTTDDAEWSLLYEFSRLVVQTRPHFVTMENVPSLGSLPVFADFLSVLEDAGYRHTWQSINCAKFGVPQERNRLVLIASRIGTVNFPDATLESENFRTVRDVIGKLPTLRSGEVDKVDALHRARKLEAINLKRIRASVPGGTWESWPISLRAPCHRRATGSTYKSVYARMGWDSPSPTITTQAYNFGTGRFGHPEQDRAITLREAAMLQSFPKGYKFVKRQQDTDFNKLGRLIGNAVPPKLGQAIGKAIIKSARPPTS